MFIGLFRHCRLALLLGLSILATTAFSQSFIGDPVQIFDPKINQRISDWQVYRLDADGLAAAAHTPNQSIFLHLGQYHWSLQMEVNPIIASTYRIRYKGEGEEYDLAPSVTPYKGTVNNSDEILRLTLGDDFVYGYIASNGDKIYVEPLWYTNPAYEKDLYLVYRASAVNKDILDGACGTDEHEGFRQHIDEKIEETENVLACYQLDLAIASDASMITKYGSVSAVEAHNIGVLNDVQGDYTGQFNHDIEFNIVTQFISSANPWGVSSNAGTYLTNFRNWGNGGGFGVAYDLAEMWTNIDFDGGTVGIAYLSAVCTSNRYHCLQDFTSNSELLRCMTSHEIGHNFSATHDNCNGGQEWIMCPFVSTANTWSPMSTSQINSFTNGLINNGCLSACTSGPPPSPAFSWSPDPGCAGEAITFENLSTGTIFTYSWTFPGGIPATSTLENPTVIWSTPGIKNVTLTLNSGTGSQATVSQQVTISSAPSADFTSLVDDLTVTFTAQASNATSYEWDFGDGNISFEQNPVHTYAEANYYQVVLTVTGPCGTATKTLTVNTEPTAMFSANPTIGCAPLAVSFTNESSPNAISYVWQFPGGSPSASNQANPVVIYQTSGTFTVTLTATNSQGSDVFSISQYITVQNIPSSSFTSSVNGLTVTFTNNSANGTNYLWNFGDGNTSTLQNPVHTYATGGNYTVTLATTNACGTTNNTQTVVLATPPVAAFTATPTSGCGPLTVQFQDNSANANSIVWSFPGGTPATSTLPNPVVVYNTPGVYTASLTATNAAGPNTATQNITVLTVPATSFASSVSGASVQFTNSSSGANAYSWNFGDGNTSAQENPTHTYTNDGVYQVVLTTTNVCGTSTAVQTVTIVTPPAAAFSANETSGCAPFTAQFNNNSSNNATSFAWEFPGGMPATSTLENPTIVYNTPGTYSVTLIATNAAGSNTSTLNSYITVLAAPSAAFATAVNGLQVSFTNSSQGGSSFAWDFGDGNTSTLENPTHTYAAAGNYTVMLTTTNACGNGTTTQTIILVQAPTASFSASPTTGCNSLTVQFSNTSAGNPTSFSWQFPGGTPATSTAANPEVVYSAPGTYSVIFTATNAAGSGTVTQTNLIQIGTSPVAGFAASGNANMFTFANSSTGATSYAWDFGDNGSSTMTNPTHTYTMDGTYTVVLTATNTCGTSTFVQTVTVVTPPLANFTATGANGCAPLSVTFNNTSSANATSFVWLFPGGNPATSTATNPTVEYANPGIYSVTLTATNSVGSSNVTQTNFVNVSTVPTPNFVSTGNGASYSFSNASSGATSYAWNFGDGTNSTAENPSHFYTADGVYTVVLTATNACGTATSSQTVTVVTPPVANFTATNNTGCAPITVTFNNTSSSNAATFSWQFPGGSPASSTEENPVVTYTAPGVYAVILTASNAAGNSTVTQTEIVVVGGLPTAGFVSATNGATVNLSNISSSAMSYHWEFGDGSISTEESPNHTYTQDGVYTVMLISANNCGADTSEQVITIVTAPTANFGISAAAGCTPFVVNYQNQSSANATAFSWEFPGGTPAISTDANPVVTYNAPGIYSATLVATNAVGSSTSFQVDIIAVNTTPFTTFSVQTGGLSAEFTNGSFNAQTYFWDFGDGNTSTESDPVHDYAAPGTYTVVLKAINECGTADFTMNVQIEGAAPIPSFSAGDQTKGCAPLTIQYTDQSVGQPNAWLWTFPGGTPATSTLQNPIVVYPAPGTYGATLEVGNAFGTNTLTQANLVEVFATPAAGFTTAIVNGTVSFENQSANANSYQWNFGDGSPVSAEASPSHTYAQSGTYTITLTAINDCGSAVFEQTVSVMVVGTFELTDWAKAVNLYPNPNNGRFTLEISGLPKEELSFELFNVMGQLIRRDVYNFETGKMSRILDYGQLSAGTYSLKVSDYQQSFVLRVNVVR